MTISTSTAGQHDAALSAPVGPHSRRRAAAAARRSAARPGSPRSPRPRGSAASPSPVCRRLHREHRDARAGLPLHDLHQHAKAACGGSTARTTTPRSAPSSATAPGASPEVDRVEKQHRRPGEPAMTAQTKLSGTSSASMTVTPTRPASRRASSGPTASSPRSGLPMPTIATAPEQQASASSSRRRHSTISRICR